MDVACAMVPATPATLVATPATFPATAAALPTLLAMPASFPKLTEIFGEGMLKQCIVMSMPDLAARDPPM